MKKQIAIIIILTMFPQILISKEKIISPSFLMRTSLCKCNHDSKIQKHEDEEDVYFDSKTSSNFNSESAREKNFPDCHSAKKGEAHGCGCKEKNSDSFFFQIGLNCYYLFVASFQFGIVVDSFSEISKASVEKLASGHFQKPIKPPEFPNVL
ncbi:LIC_11090 family protein [Leptospira adleri]|uniref:Uncharacterized protein n=1 Tax=Leptospira adleri TaxID=2023186 RepID=A0A2M9YKJ7_9LEPT|nr:hypothetical protein [Leptospira adleri]PJZ52069.1 hypothetical protein CH380_16645 [Leptospira adleri]PJZ62931.1 hypothetical protein CH376_05425 [Leptospira adleri]